MLIIILICLFVCYNCIYKSRNQETFEQQNNIDVQFSSTNQYVSFQNSIQNPVQFPQSHNTQLVYSFNRQQSGVINFDEALRDSVLVVQEKIDNEFVLPSYEEYTQKFINNKI